MAFVLPLLIKWKCCWFRNFCNRLNRRSTPASYSSWFSTLSANWVPSRCVSETTWPAARENLSQKTPWVTQLVRLLSSSGRGEGVRPHTYSGLLSLLGLTFRWARLTLGGTIQKTVPQQDIGSLLNWIIEDFGSPTSAERSSVTHLNRLCFMRVKDKPGFTSPEYWACGVPRPGRLGK